MGGHPGMRYCLACIAFCIAACGLGHTRHDKPATVFVAVLDPSTSTDATSRCAEALARLRPLVSAPRPVRVDALVLATGDRTAEPTVVVPWTTYAPSGPSFESPGAAERRRGTWLSSVHSVCQAKIHATASSPVLEAVDRTATAIAARCQTLSLEGAVCTRRVLLVASDLRSNTGVFGAYMRALAKHRGGVPPVPPAHVVLEGIEASYCGFSNTDAGDGVPAAVVLAAWRAVVSTPIMADPVCAVDRAFLTTQGATDVR